jgi:hypothetical protein
MKHKFSINRLTLAFASLLLSAVFVGCTYKHDGKLVKDVDGRIYKLEGNGRTSEAYHLIPIDTVDYESRFLK